MKNKIILLSAASILSLGAFLGFNINKNNNVEAKMAVKNIDDSITFLNGASIRADVNENGITGIRFTSFISQDLYNKLVENGNFKENCSIGMMIVPELAFNAFDKNANVNDYFTYFANQGKNKNQISSDFSIDKICYENDKYKLQGVVDLKPNNYTLKYQAVTYYTFGSEYYYSNRSDARSIVCVADAALKDDKSGLSETQISKLQYLVNKYDNEKAHTFVDNECIICHGKKEVDVNSIDELNQIKSISTTTSNVNINLEKNVIDVVKDGYTSIGNKDISDLHFYKKTNELNEFEKEYVIYTNKDDSILTTSKKGQTFTFNGGIFTGKKVVSPNEVKTNTINFYLPDNATIIFDGTTFKGAINFISQWQQIVANGYSPEVKYPHVINKLIIRNCTFDDGAIFQNGSFAKEILFENCTFNEFKNENNSNPMWFINAGSQDLGWYINKGTSISINKCTFNMSRPLKIYEQAVGDVNLKITNNIFNLIDTGDKKNNAIVFSSCYGESSDIEIYGNTVNNALALLSFADDSLKMKENAKFIVKDNILNDAKLSVKWKSEESYIPSFVETDLAKAYNTLFEATNIDLKESTKDVTYNGYGVVDINEWQDLWVNCNLTIKGVNFKNGAVFNTNNDNITITLIDCTFYACNQEKITASHKVNSGGGMCLDLETREHNNINFVVKNCKSIGENNNTLSVYSNKYKADGTIESNKKKRGHGIVLNAIQGGDTGSNIYSLDIENCIITGVRGHAIQLYGTKGNIVVKNTTLESYGINKDNLEVESSGIRGTYSIDRTLNIENVTFGLDENIDTTNNKALVHHVNIDDFDKNSTGKEIKGTYSIN